MWVVMNRFGYGNLLDESNGSRIHRLENVMTVVYDFRALFDELKVWFVSNCAYKITIMDCLTTLTMLFNEHLAE